MKAALLRRIPALDLDVTTVRDVLSPEADQLLIRVDACGICGTDIHLMDGESFKPDLPFVLGHEPVGIVVDAGSPELKSWIGTRVTATIFVGCGKCSLCRTEDERLCRCMREVTGLLGASGGYAEYLTLRMTQVVEVPSALSSETSASLADAGPTAVNAVRTALTQRRETVVVVGAGPVGFLCAELLRLSGVEPSVVEPNIIRRDLLQQLRYNVVVSLDDLSTLAPDAVIDCSAATGVVEWSLEHLMPGGMFVAVGFQTVNAFPLLPVVRKEIALAGVRSGTRRDLMRILDLAATRRIQLPSISTWSLDHINDALKAMREGRLQGKAVVQVRVPSV